MNYRPLAKELEGVRHDTTTGAEFLFCPSGSVLKEYELAEPPNAVDPIHRGDALLRVVADRELFMDELVALHVLRDELVNEMEGAVGEVDRRKVQADIKREVAGYHGGKHLLSCPVRFFYHTCRWRAYDLSHTLGRMPGFPKSQMKPFSTDTMQSKRIGAAAMKPIHPVANVMSG